MKIDEIKNYKLEVQTKTWEAKLLSKLGQHSVWEYLKIGRFNIQKSRNVSWHFDQELGPFQKIMYCPFLSGIKVSGRIIVLSKRYYW